MEALFHEWILNFIKHFTSVDVIFPLNLLRWMIILIDFVEIKPLLYFWDKHNLVITYYPSSML